MKGNVNGIPFFHHLAAEELIFVLPCFGLSEQAAL
jgi:hypothetical protein